MEQIEVYFADLCLEKQIEIVEIDSELKEESLDYNSPSFVSDVESLTNWDIVPLTIIDL